VPHNGHLGHRPSAFEICDRNPKRIKRWPSHVMPTRHHQHKNPDQGA
jgi:hypothetical protein